MNLEAPCRRRARLVARDYELTPVALRGSYILETMLYNGVLRKGSV